MTISNGVGGFECSVIIIHDKKGNIRQCFSLAVYVYVIKEKEIDYLSFRRCSCEKEMTFMFKKIMYVWH